jgi:phospholipid/cholesterol/gamma-HCH transport system substrate-binding protein
MASQRTKFAVGLFVACGIGITLMAIIWLGMSRYLEKGNFYAAYFDESVQGLSKDSPVKYRGVSIGRVESIKVAPDSKLIQVLLKIESNQALDRSIIAQLKDVGITGSMFVELDRKEENEPDRSPRITFPSEYPIVASKPSDLSELLRGLDDALNHIKTIDLKGISDKLKLTLDNVSQMIADADVKTVSAKVQTSLDNIDRMIVDADVKGVSTKLQSSLESAGRILDSKRWDRILASVDDAAQSLNKLMDKAGSSLGQMNKILEGVEGVVADNEKDIKKAVEDLRQAMKNANVLLERGVLLIGSADDAFFQLKRQLSVSAQNLEKATDNLNQFLELLADHPSQLIFGEPPVPLSVEPEGKEW